MLYEVITVDQARASAARFMQLVAQDENALNLLAGARVPSELLPEGLETVLPPREISAGFPSSYNFV